QADRIAPHQIAEVRAVRLRLRQVDAGLAPAVALEDQVLVLQQAAPAGQGRVLVVVLHGVGRGRAADGVHGAHYRTSARADFRAAMSASVVISVAATSRTSSMPAAGATRP